jgi:hypothetical protein
MRRTQAVVPASMIAPACGAEGAAAAGASGVHGGSPALVGVSGGMQTQQPSPQAQPLTGTPTAPWMYTSAGWVQAGPGMVQPLTVPMHGMQAPPLQQQMLPGAAAGALVPVDTTMLSNLAAGLSGLSLQEQADFVSSGQVLACMPGMLPGSPTSGLMYSQSSGGYAMQAPAVPRLSPAAAGAGAIYAPVPALGAGMPQHSPQQPHWQ